MYLPTKGNLGGPGGKFEDLLFENNKSNKTTEIIPTTNQNMSDELFLLKCLWELVNTSHVWWDSFHKFLLYS